MIMNFLSQKHKAQNGQILILTMIMLTLSSLVVVPLLGYMNTGLNAVDMYQNKTKLLYAADAGISEALWNILYTDFEGEHDESDLITLDPIMVNNKEVTVQIDYTSVLMEITGGDSGVHADWIDITTSVDETTGTYTVEIEYTEDGNKKLTEIGIWLPSEFDYVSDSSANFEDNFTHEEPEVTTSQDGTSIVWSGFAYSFKNEGSTVIQHFNYTPAGEIPQEDFAWIQVLSNDVGYVYDNMIWNYTITATAVDPSTGKSLTAQAHVSKSTGDTNELSIQGYRINP
jgi:hypothetical protein